MMQKTSAANQLPDNRQRLQRQSERVHRYWLQSLVQDQHAQNQTRCPLACLEKKAAPRGSGAKSDPESIGETPLAPTSPGVAAPLSSFEIPDQRSHNSPLLQVESSCVGGPNSEPDKFE